MKWDSKTLVVKSLKHHRYYIPIPQFRGLNPERGFVLVFTKSLFVIAHEKYETYKS